MIINVWVLVAFTTVRLSPIVIDNISSKEECLRVMSHIPLKSVDIYNGHKDFSRCIEVRKVTGVVK